MSVTNRSPIPAVFQRSIFVLACTAVLGLGLAANCGGQERVAPESELPSDAIWRFGEFGDEPTDANGIYRLQYSRDGKLLATRNRKNIVSIYDVTTRKRLCEIDGYENNWVETIDFSPDSKFFVTAAGSSEKVKIWHAQTGKLESEIDADAVAAYFNQSGTLINLMGTTHVESYSWPGAQLVSQRKWKNGNETGVAMSHDGRIAVTYRTLPRQIYQTQVIDLETKSKIQLDGSTAIPKAVAISTNRLWLAAAYHRDAKIRLWDLRDPHQKKYTLNRHNETVQSLSFSEDGRFLVSSGWDEKVVAWDLLTRQAIGQFDGHTEHVNATAFSPLDLTFASGASGSTDTSIIVWDLKDRLLTESLNPDRDMSFGAVWAAMGHSAIANSLKATNRLINDRDEFLDELDRRLGEFESEETSGTLEASIKLLEHPEWAVRENATQQLLKIRDKADAELRHAFAEATSPEVRYRISRILRKKIDRPKSNVADLRRWHRTIFALEQINTPQAQSLLKKISQLNPDIDVIEDAKASYRRNEVRSRLER